MKRQRHSRQSWVDAGLKALSAQGPHALAAEPLARALGTTKGSFYWHFKDVPDYHKAVVQHWQAQAYGDVVGALAEEGAPDDRLRRFGNLVLSNKHEAAMRAWGRADKMVAKAIAQVDAERMTYISSLLRQLGVSNDDFAKACLATLIGLPDLDTKSRAVPAYEALIDLVLALK